MIQFRKDNVLYFVTNTGTPSDKGAVDMIEFNKIEIKQNFNQSVLPIQRKGAKQTISLFSYCILKQLRNSIDKLNAKVLSVARSEHVENLPWSKMLLAQLEIPRIRNHLNPQNTKITTKFGPKSPHLNKTIRKQTKKEERKKEVDLPKPLPPFSLFRPLLSLLPTTIYVNKI